MLQLKNITITHKKDLRTIIKNFSFYLHQGDKIAIIGEEGNGKSTLLKLIYDEALIDPYADHTGEIIKNNNRLGYLPQEFPADQKQKTVYEYCSALYDWDDIPKLSQIAALFGQTTDFFYSDQTIQTLSGGEKIKLQLAMLMMAQPDILLLDEPSNDIDIPTLEWLEKFINTTTLPILFISHDETLLENTTTGIIHIEQVKKKREVRITTERIPYRQYIEKRTHNLSHQDQVARKEREEYEKQQEVFRQIQSKVEHRQNTVSRASPHEAQLLKKKMKSIKSMEKRFEKQYEEMTEIPSVEEAIWLKFENDIQIPRGKKILDIELDSLTIENRCLAQNIGLLITGGEKVAIIGKNGVGKSTLLKRIAAQLLQRQDIQVSYMPQNYDDAFNFTQTPVEFLSTKGDKAELTKIRTFLGAVKFTTDEMDHPISEISGGQKAKLLFLQMILAGSNVLLLDEPTRNFSPLSNPVIREILKSYTGAIISISHDRKYIQEVCTKTYTLTETGLHPQ